MNHSQQLIPRGSYSHLPLESQQQLAEIDVAIARVLATVGKVSAREKYKLFAECFLKNGFNASKAYESAGYKCTNPASKYNNASRLIGNDGVSALIALGMRKLNIHENFQLHQEKSIRELNRLAYSNIADVVEVDPRTGEIKIRSLDTLSEDVTAAIQHISCTRKLIPQKDGDPIEETKLDVRMHKKPIETLMRGTKVVGAKDEDKRPVIHFNLDFGGGDNGLPTDGGLTGTVIESKAEGVG